MSERNPELFDLIEAYLNTNLDEKAKKDFEQRLDIDLELRHEAEKHRLLQESIVDDDALNFRKKLVAFEEQYFNTNSFSIKKSIYRWKYAAVLLVIFGIGTFIIHQNVSSKKSLFETYFQAYPLEDALRGSEEETLKIAFGYYSNGDYSKAIPILKNLTREIPNKYPLKLYLGNAYLKNNSPKKALQELKLLTNTPYQEQGKWYMALCYIKINENDKAILLLENLIAYDGIYKKEAQNLYEDLAKELN